MNPQTQITETAFVRRFNAELAARNEPARLVADRSTKLGDFVWAEEGGARVYMSDWQAESLARRHGILADNETVTFETVPMGGRAYGPDA